jgi:hypothetical protein
MKEPLIDYSKNITWWNLTTMFVCLNRKWHARKCQLKRGSTRRRKWLCQKKRKLQKKLKESLPNTRGQMRGLWKKLWQSVVIKCCGEKGKTLNMQQTKLTYFYLWMPIKPHSMKLFLGFDSSTWNKQLHNEKCKEKVQMLHRFLCSN